MSDEHLPWERRADETAKAFAAFRIYRDLGADRTCREVWEQLDRAPGLIKRWSSTHEWVERARAWDAHTDAAWRAEVIRGVSDLARDQVRVLRSVQKAVGDALEAGAGAPTNPDEVVALVKQVTEATRALAALLEASALAPPLPDDLRSPPSDDGERHVVDASGLFRMRA